MSNTSTSLEKSNLFEKYIAEYTDKNKYRFCEIALNKFRFENYKMSDRNIKDKDYIIQNKTLREYIQAVIDTKKCEKNQFKYIFDNLNLDQIYYIGF